MKKILIILVIVLSVPTSSFAGTFKAYTDYRCLNSKMSKQYKLQQKAYTDNQGLRRLNGYYNEKCIKISWKQSKNSKMDM